MSYLVIPSHVVCHCDPDRHSKNTYDEWNGKVVPMVDRVSGQIAETSSTAVDIIVNRVTEHLKLYPVCQDGKAHPGDFDLHFSTQEIKADGSVDCDPKSRSRSIRLK